MVPELKHIEEIAMKVYFELLGLVYARGEDRVVLEDAEREIQAQLEKEGFGLCSYVEADAKLYVSLEHGQSMHGLEKEPGYVVGISREFRRGGRESSVFAARNGKVLPYSSGGGGGLFEKKGQLGSWVLDELKWANEQLAVHLARTEYK